MPNGHWLVLTDGLLTVMTAFGLRLLSKLNSIPNKPIGVPMQFHDIP